MNTAARSLTGIAVVAIAGLVIFSQLGFADLKWPWQEATIISRTSSVTTLEKPTVVEIQPIALDCRARIHTSVPIVGVREHRALGQVYRTDTVSMTAIGDIDTCVDATQVRIDVSDSGTAQVFVPAEAIEFVRPRVDTVATLDSVDYSQGLLGKITDIFPWVSDDHDLTPAAYAYAQTVIGSSDCMAEAYDTTREAMDVAYRSQMEAAGLDPADIEVFITGVPDFEASGTDIADLDGFDFRVDGENPTCEVAADAFRPPPPADAEAI